MTDSEDVEARDWLQARGAEAEALAIVAASGLSLATACRAVRAVGLASRLRRLLRPHSQLSPAERQRLVALVDLAREVMANEGGAAGAQRFWEAPMHWLGGRSPAITLARRDGIGIVHDLVQRIRYGIPP